MVINNNSFWKDKKILITGITGFLGSWSAIWALENGAKVIGISRTDRKDNSNFYLCKLNEKISVEFGSITDRTFVEEICEKYKPDVLLHLAGQAIEGLETENKQTYETNVLGTLSILECLRKYDYIRGCVFVTTSKSYVNSSWETIYSKSKGCADILIETYRDKYFSGEENCKILNLMLCNIIGGGDWGKNRLVPDCINALENNREIQLKTPSAKIYLNSIFEVVEGIYSSLENVLVKKGKKESIFYELKNKIYISVKELVNSINRVYLEKNDECDKSIEYVNEGFIDKSNKIEFNEYLPLRRIVENTIEWYGKYPYGDIYELCARQLNENGKRLRGE